jgi:hypothetical protein
MTARKVRAKVVWTEPERVLIVSRAVDLQATEPKLSGLNLLRTATEVLPVDRRRRLIALSQTPWFLPAVREEIARRSATTGESERLKEVLEATAGWKGEHLKALAEAVPAMVGLLNAATIGESLLTEIVETNRQSVKLLEQLVEVTRRPPEPR